MPLGQLLVDADRYPLVPTPCLRCGVETPLRFVGPCAACAEALRAEFVGPTGVVEAAEYEPKMNVTPNAVALKD
jgi:hypothetical protein